MVRLIAMDIDTVNNRARASMHALQRPEDLNPEDPRLSQSTIRTYLGIDKRNGLSAMAQRLLKGDFSSNSRFSYH